MCACKELVRLPKHSHKIATKIKVSLELLHKGWLLTNDYNLQVIAGFLLTNHTLTAVHSAKGFSMLFFWRQESRKAG